ncbi:MAG: YicC family protein [Lachnospiraceae bacterium]|nr:YicC family protein [Lachnospiraceae bacterium]MCR5410594.1 YicC family protein [Lachnospiraceae bacterium]
MANIKSMTGFGRGEVTENNRKFTVEIKAVNHRYLEASLKLPKKLSAFEANIRNVMKEYMERGKVDVFITLEDYNEAAETVKYNSALAHEYMKYLQEMSEEFGVANDIRLSVLARFPDVFTMEDIEADEDELWGSLEKAVRSACEKFVAAREKEGENLRTDLMKKLDEMAGYVDFIEQRSPEIVAEYRKKLEDKLRDMLSTLDVKADEGRIVTEVTIYSDKICVDEEIVRLKSHVKAMKDELSGGGACGRKLDFIAQEMNREANTTLSKSGDLALTDKAIELKTVIEKIREQIQNVE